MIVKKILLFAMIIYCFVIFQFLNNISTYCKDLESAKWWKALAGLWNHIFFLCLAKKKCLAQKKNQINVNFSRIILYKWSIFWILIFCVLLNVQSHIHAFERYLHFTKVPKKKFKKVLTFLLVIYERLFKVLSHLTTEIRVDEIGVISKFSWQRWEKI